ncbi:uncharacterized protein PITG_22394, partial [Phytophthora infestans T30-4]
GHDLDNTEHGDTEFTVPEDTEQEGEMKALIQNGIRERNRRKLMNDNFMEGLRKERLFGPTDGDDVNVVAGQDASDCHSDADNEDVMNDNEVVLEVEGVEDLEDVSLNDDIPEEGLFDLTSGDLRDIAENGWITYAEAESDDVQLDTQLYTMIELEGNRYRAFFAKLCGGDNSLISRDAALEFFRKSSLSEEQVQELYTRLKELHLLRDNAHMNETEFVMGMHFIVCMTKRNLVKIPPKFPGYLFPSLDLTPERQQSFDFPSPEEHSYTSEASSGTPLVPPPSTRLMGAMGPTISQIATSPMTSGAPLVDTKSLRAKAAPIG